MGRRRKKKGFWYCLFMVIAICLLPFTTMLDMAEKMERDRKKRGRHNGVMCGPGGSRRKRK